MKRAVSIFLLCTSILTLHAENWMKRLPNNAYVSTISIPGTHDSCTGNGFPGVTTSIYGPFGDKYARTQDKTIEEQWEMGIRAFDFRPAIQDGYINVNHGIMPTKVRFDNVLYFLRDKLIENPSEFVVIHLLHASAGDKNSSAYGTRLLELFGRDDLKDFLADFKSTLTVGEMRGKILLLSREEYADRPVGGFFLNWTGQIDWEAQRQGEIIGATGSKAKLYMQDYAETFRSGDLDRKVEALRQLLEFSTQHVTSTPSDIVWVYNFASAYSKVSRLYIPLIVNEEISTSDGYRENASYTNSAIIDFLTDPSHQPGPTGIVLLDYVGVNSSNGYNIMGQDVVDIIIDNNFRYLQDMDQVTKNSATYRTPLDMTARIENASFNCNLTGRWDGTAFGAVNPNENAEHFNKNFDTHQTIKNLPNGVYAISVKAFYRCGDIYEAESHYRIKDPTTRYARLYAVSGRDTLSTSLVSPFSISVYRPTGVGREKSLKKDKQTYYIPDDMISAEHYMHQLKAYNNTVFIGINRGSLTFGVRKNQMASAEDWCMFDDFTLTYYGDQPESYKKWISEMRRKKVNYANVTVSTPYLDAYNNAYNTDVTNRAQAMKTMKAVEAVEETLAVNASLWVEYKEAGRSAEGVMEGDILSEEAKAALLAYYVNVYTKNIEEHMLTNEQLIEAITDMRSFIALLTSGQWTSISMPDAKTRNDKYQRVTCYDLQGRRMKNNDNMYLPSARGLFILRSDDGSVRKILR